MSRYVCLIFWGLCGLTLFLLTFCPGLDLAVSGLVATGNGFLLRDNAFLTGMTRFVFYFSRFLAVLFLGLGCLALLQRRPVAGLSPKALFFLLLALLVGPGLMANVVFKDHWGRARPRNVLVFGGQAAFTPAFVMSNSCQRNCSFVSGDAAFGFFLPSFAYVVPRRRSRQVFWGAMGVGWAFSLARILLGAHFLSDVLAAMFLVLAVSAGLFAALYGRGALRQRWQDWMFLPSRPVG